MSVMITFYLFFFFNMIELEDLYLIAMNIVSFLFYVIEMNKRKIMIKLFF